MFARRLGPDPHQGGTPTAELLGCPDLWELQSGDFAVIGRNITAVALPHLPKTASCGPDEAIVQIPRKALVFAKKDIPDAL
jgi:hypothetical protein